MSYIIIYLATAFSSLVTNGRRGERFFLVLALAFFAAWIGLRFYTGCDYGSYYLRYLTYENTPFSEYLTLRISSPTSYFTEELGFIGLNYALIALGLDYDWLNIISAILYMIGIYFFLRRRENTMALLTLFIPLLLIQLGMSGIRQALALGFMMLAYNAFTDKKPIWVGVWILVASQFHFSAMFFAPMVLLTHGKVTLFKLILVVAVTIPFATALGGNRIDVYQNRYLENELDSDGAVFRVAITALTALFFELKKKTFQQIFPKDYPLMRLFSLYSFVLVVLLLVSSVIAHRINFYVAPVSLLILMRLPLVMSKGQKDAVLNIMPYFVFFLYLAVWLKFSGSAKACYLPYDSIITLNL